MNTKEMLDAALELAKLKSCPADAAVINPGENIKKALVGIDMNVQELVIGRMLDFDCVVSHHPRCTNTKGMDELFLEQRYAMFENGIPITEAQKLINASAGEGSDYRLFSNNDRNASASKILKMPYVCIHTPADIIVETALQKMFDARFAEKPRTRLCDVLDVFKEIPEYSHAVFEPKIAVGEPESYAGRIHVIMSGVTGGGPDVYNAYFRAGIGTLVLMHCTGEDVKKVDEAHIGNIINAGHMASDSYGMNRIIEAWEARGVEVVRMSGLLSPEF